MDLIEQPELIKEQVRQNFSSLSNGQLNWKPGPAKWSIAQCIDHLLISGSSYFPTFDKLLDGTYKLPLLQRLNPLNKIFGPIMVKSLGPRVTKKLKNPKIFDPSSSAIPTSIVTDFLNLQD